MDVQSADDDLSQPNSRDAEAAVLGSILLRNELFCRAAAIVRSGDFHRDAHRRIFKAIAELNERGDAIDLITLKEVLAHKGDLEDVGGVAFISRLLDGGVRAANVEHYAGIVRRKAAQREIIRAALAVSTSAAGDADDLFEHIASLKAGVSALEPTAVAADFVESLPAFLATELEKPAPRMLVDGVLPCDGISLWHGQPRSLKTWGVLDVLLAGATGTEAFGGCAVAERFPVLFVTEEDPRRRVAERLDALCRGRRLPSLPEDFLLAVHRGVSLDDAEWQERIIATVRAHGVRVVGFEPVRSLSGCVDKGPAELRPLTMFLRRLQAETNCALLLSHHDTKPMAGMRDDRSRAQRASGGGLFSIAEAPVHFERISETPATSLMVPTAWKHSELPSAREVTLVVDAEGARLVSAATSQDRVEASALSGRILMHLKAVGEASGSAIQKAVKARKEDVLLGLEKMLERGLVDSRPGSRNATLWFVSASGSSGSERFLNGEPVSGSSGSPLRGGTTLGTAEAGWP